MSTSFASLVPQLQRAQLLLQQGRGGEAWSILAPLRQAMDGHGQALRLYALAAQGVGRVDEAASALQRILDLEGNPPEIIGALADMLGQAGRHSDALVHWDRLVALRPDLSDAHLNRAIAASESGQHERAIAAADAGLKRFKGHARLLAVKALALKNSGRIAESVALFEQAVAADPRRPLTRHNQAVALRAAFRFDEACEAYAEAERLGMRGPQFHANWAAAALEAGQVEQATQLYRRALAEDPAHRESLTGLARLEIEYHGGSDAFAHYGEAAATRGFTAEAYLEWIDALMRNNRPREAAEVAGQAVARHPDHQKLGTLHPYLTGMTGEPGPSLDELERQAKRRPGDTFLMDSIQVLAIRAQRWDRAEELLQHQLAREPENQIIWAKLSLIWRLLDDPREHWLCDYDRLVMVTEVPSPDGLLEPPEFARIMADTLDPLHRALHAPGDQTLRGGTQSSSSLFDRPEPEIQEFKKAIMLAADELVGALPEDATHPFLRRKSARLDIVGSWSVRLRSGGHHVSHVHHEGWMSSAYYARLPRSSEQAQERHEGWIHFGVPPENYGIDLAPRRIVQPQPGRLVLFPSYMWHGTIPFSDGDRLTAAFDFQPR